MKLLLKSIFLLYINTLCINYTLAQTPSLEIMSTSKNEINMPPLKVVIDSVIKRNAMVRFRKQHVEVQASKIKSERIVWTNNLGIQVDANYGTFANISSNAGDGQLTRILNSTSKQFNYQAGIFVKFPLFDFLNRPNRINLAKKELEESKSMVQFEEDEIRQTTIKLYQDLILKQKLLHIKSESLGNERVNNQMVDKEFRNGLVPISEYVRISSMYANMQSDYELAKANFLIAKQILEDMAGFVFNVTPSN